MLNRYSKYQALYTKMHSAALLLYAILLDCWKWLEGKNKILFLLKFLGLVTWMTTIVEPIECFENAFKITRKFCTVKDLQ